MEHRGPGPELGTEEGQAPVAPALLILDESEGLFPDLVDPAERIAGIAARLAHTDEAGRIVLWDTLTPTEQAAVAHALTPALMRRRAALDAGRQAHVRRLLTDTRPQPRNRAERRAQARKGRH